jgi:hypothetical protein
MYNPAMGVWTIRDPAQEGLNPYQYVQSKAVCLLDPYGLLPHTYRIWDGASFPINPAQDAEIAASKAVYKTQLGQWSFFHQHADPWVVIGQIQAAANIMGLGAQWVGKYPNAVKALRHFLGNSGTPFFMDYATMLAQDKPALDHAIESVRSAQRFVEAHSDDLLSGKRSIIATGWMSVSRVSHPDWQLAVGQYYTLAAAQNIKCEAGVYSMDWQIDLQDFYNWDPTDTDKKGLPVSPAELYLLHVYGRGQHFMQYGSYAKTITWKKGEDAALAVP